MEEDKGKELRKLYEHFEKGIKQDGIKKMEKQEDFYSEVQSQLIQTKE